LAEVAVASAVFVVAALGTFSIFLSAYRVAALARYRDQAQAVLRTFADQFERLQVTAPNPATGQTQIRWFFQRCDPPGTGQGLKWDKNNTGLGVTSNTLCDDPGGSAPTTTGAYLSIVIGDGPNAIPATVTRTVRSVYCDPSVLNPHYAENGNFVPITQPDPISTAGMKLVYALFHIEYTVNQQLIKQDLEILRTEDP
jgi:hypothetical protein